MTEGPVPVGSGSPVDDAVVRIGMALVQAAGRAASTEERAARAVLDVLHEDPAVCASALDVVVPATGWVRTPCSLGYRPAVSAHLRSADFRVHDQGYRLLREQPGCPARSWSDVEGYETGPSVTRVFRPGGYTGGATARLTTATGRHVGDLHLSTAGGRTPDPRVVTALNLVGPTLASLLDPTRRLGVVAAEIADGADAALVDVSGDVAPVPGFALPNAEVLAGVAVVLARPGGGGDHRALVGSRWHLVRLVPVAAGVLVLVSAQEPPAELSARELEVLTHLVDGLTNRATARRLGIAERTVAHHVEHVMGKLGASSRAAAATVAVSEGLRLLPRGVRA